MSSGAAATRKTANFPGQKPFVIATSCFGFSTPASSPAARKPPFHLSFDAQMLE